MISFLKKYYSLLIILLLLVFFGINNYIWLRLNKLPPTSDQAFHLLSNLKYLEILTKPSWDIFARLFQVDTFYPPFFPFCAAILNLIFGHSITSSIMTNMIFAIVLFFSIYYIGRKWEDKNTGLFAVFIVSMYPYIFGLSKTFLLEFALTALVCFSFCCLLYTDNFSRKGYSALFGISLGLGMLTKPTFIFFLIGPLIITIIRPFWNYKISLPQRKTILNLGIVFIIFVIITGSWYFQNFSNLWQRMSIKGNFFGPLRILTSSVYYFKLLIFDQIAPFFTFLFFTGLILLLKDKYKFKSLLTLLLWIIVPYMLFILMNVRFMSYTVPNLPAVALISSWGILKIQNRYIKRCLVYIVIIWALIQYNIISYTTPTSVKIRVSFPTSVKIRNSFFSEKTSFDFSQPCHILPIVEFFYHFPRKGDWKLDEIIRVIDENNPGHRNLSIGVTDADIGGRKVGWFDPDPRVLATSWQDNLLVVNHSAVEYFIKVKKLPYKIVGLMNAGEHWMNSPLLDFIISIKEMKVIAPTIARYYALILQTAVPDGSPIYVYEKRDLREY